MPRRNKYSPEQIQELKKVWDAKKAQKAKMVGLERIVSTDVTSGLQTNGHFMGSDSEERANVQRTFKGGLPS